MHRSHLLAPLLIAAAASMFLAAPAAAQSYVSITGCSVSPEEIFLAPGESATLTLTVEGDDEWAWTTIVVDGVVTIDEAQRTSDTGVEFSYDILAAEVEDSTTQTWWAVDSGGNKVGDPLCSVTVSLASGEIPVVGSTMLPVVAVAASLAAFGGTILLVRRRAPGRR
jgi:hypothetical protein